MSVIPYDWCIVLRVEGFEKSSFLSGDPESRPIYVLQHALRVLNVPRSTRRRLLLVKDVKSVLLHQGHDLIVGQFNRSGLTDPEG